MRRLKYNEANVPDGIKVRVRYTKGQPWHTSCHLVQGAKLVAVGHSSCSIKDQPTRRIGRAIAVGRALKMYMEELASE